MTFDAASLASRLLPSPRPALTVYDGEGRVELSGRVVATWAYKTANLLAEEDLAGGVVVLDLPVSWRVVPAALGIWVGGASVSFGLGEADAIFTDEPSQAEAGEVFAVDPSPLALSWSGDLGSWRDGIAEVTGQPDLLLGPPPSPAPVALVAPEVRSADLEELLSGGTSGRLAIEVATPWELTRFALAQWLAGGSLVAFAPGLGSREDLSRLAEQEGATLR